MLSPVEFVAEIDAMHAAGSRLFVELGPKGIVANMARQTLAGKDASTISLDGNGGGMRGLLMGLAELRSEERRVGKGGVRTCRSRWAPYHSQKKPQMIKVSILTKKKNK